MVDRKLFNISQDSWQSRDVAADFPEAVMKLHVVHAAWYLSVRSGMKPTRIVISHDAENPAELTSQEWQTAGGHNARSRSHLVERKPENTPWLVTQDGRKRAAYFVTVGCLN